MRTSKTTEPGKRTCDAASSIAGRCLCGLGAASVSVPSDGDTPALSSSVPPFSDGAEELSFAVRPRFH
jgi:hypothetical protein